MEVRPGQALDGLDFSLPRAGVIAGRVSDDLGDGVANVVVSALRPSFLLGRLELLPVEAATSQSDDHGEFRIWDLAPGSYYLIAASGWSRTFYPGVGTEAFASRVQVRAGEEAVADFRMLQDRPVPIAGTIVTSEGGPAAGASVRVRSPGRLSGFRSASTDEQGRFDLLALPGEYRLAASAFDRQESATASVSVGNAGLSGLFLAMAPDATLRGRVRRADSGPTPARLEVHPTAIPREYLDTPGRGFPVNRDGTFDIHLGAGRYLLLVDGLPPGWTVARCTAGETAVPDMVFDVAPGQEVAGLDLLLSRDITEIAGDARDHAGETVSSYAIIVFPEDRQRWSLLHTVMRLERADQRGRFAARDLPPGRYLAVALTDVDPHEWADPDFLVRLVPLATAVTLSAGEEKRISLTVQEVQ